MHQPLARQRALDHGVAFGGGLAHARAHRQDQVRAGDALAQFRRHGPADVAGGIGMALVEAFQAAPGRAYRQLEAFGERGGLSDGLGAPACAAQQHEGPLGLVQQFDHARQVGRAGQAARAPVARHVGHAGAAPQRVLGQRQYHRPGPAAGGHREGARDEFGNPLGAVDLRDPLGHLAEHAAVVDFLERLALHEVVADLADEQNHRGRVLVGRMHADAGVGGAGAAGDEADPRLAGQLAIGLGHVGRAAFLAADNGVDGAAMLVQGVDAGQVALAGNHEHAPRAVHAQLLHQDLAAVALGQGWRGHDCSPWDSRGRAARAAHCSNSAWRASRRRAVL
ncbi:Uncharacterised protein [Bordetella pertussis]|nr:Uncharacterised protein [Bordetella pertussis]CFM12659.1 Uncharacterised protein [Bordetella pertussis]CFM38412.1 Uncharacterised protein [Bordetella pertussis]CFM49692.1 Uncharacterised protein [Bordetella pertussis]CFM63956.1 Uncharacterised protein [Bordetella pertussis]